MPRLTFMRLGNDHTGAAGKIAPPPPPRITIRAGHVVDKRFGNRASGQHHLRAGRRRQNGDHVDSHRSPAFVISPCKTLRGDGSMRNNTSILRTMEHLPACVR
jgi:hypothetical protein